MAPAEDNELLLVLNGDVVKELPEVLDELAVLLIVGLVLGVLCAPAQKRDVRNGASTDPRLDIVQVANVEHALRNYLADTSANSLDLSKCLRQSGLQGLANKVKSFIKVDFFVSTVAFICEVEFLIIGKLCRPIERHVLIELSAQAQILLHGAQQAILDLDHVIESDLLTRQLLPEHLGQIKREDYSSSAANTHHDSQEEEFL